MLVSGPNKQWLQREVTKKCKDSPGRALQLAQESRLWERNQRKAEIATKPEGNENITFGLHNLCLSFVLTGVGTTEGYFDLPRIFPQDRVSSLPMAYHCHAISSILQFYCRPQIASQPGHETLATFLWSGCKAIVHRGREEGRSQIGLKLANDKCQL